MTPPGVSGPGMGLPRSVAMSRTKKASVCSSISRKPTNMMVLIGQSSGRQAVGERSSRPMTGQSSPRNDWQATGLPHRHGAPVGIKKQVGPGLWVSTVARPGDTHYPVHP